MKRPIERNIPEVLKRTTATEAKYRSTGSIIPILSSASRVVPLAIIALLCLSGCGPIIRRPIGVVARAQQDVTLELDASSGSPADEPTERDEQFFENKVKTLDEFLDGLPTLSVGQKHTARFECELNTNKELDFSELAWIRLNRVATRPGGELTGANSSQTGSGYETRPISINKKMITPDKRFKVGRQSPTKWTLSIDNVGPDDNHSYFLCQPGPAKQGAKRTGQSGVGYVDGARLNVLVPPRIVEQETSGSSVLANEFESLSLRCKVVSEPQSQLTWKREDGKSIEQLEQRLKHEVERRKNQILSIDSSELIFSQFTRQQAGAYLCIASNGVQPGVSQRVGVSAANCRAAPAPSARSEPCERADEPTDGANELEAGAREPAPRRSWKTSARPNGEPPQTRRQQRPSADKRRAPTKPGSNGLVSIRPPVAATEAAAAAAAAVGAGPTVGLISAAAVSAFVLLHLASNIIIATTTAAAAAAAVHYNSIVIL